MVRGRGDVGDRSNQVSRQGDGVKQVDLQEGDVTV
jgi:hypothetical protein